MTKQAPAVSMTIITATYNSAATIADCLTSVASQTVGVEHLVVDGASSDGTMETIRSFGSPVDAVSEPDGGIYDAMNKGIARAGGEVVGILNSDDYYASETVLARVGEAFRDPAMDACYGDLVYVDFQDPSRVVRYWKAGPYDVGKFHWGWMPPHPAFFVRRSVYERFGSFNLGLGSAADYEIMLRFLLKHRLKTAYIPGVLVKMRTGGVSNASWRNRLAANRKDRQAWKVNGLRPYPWTLWAKPVRKLGQWVAKGPQSGSGV